MNRSLTLLIANGVLWTLLLLSCQGPSRTISPAFYHWKSEFSPDEGERQWLDSLAVQRLYVRMFDVDVDERAGGIRSIAETRLDPAIWPPGVELVPTVYLTNRCMQQVSKAAIPIIAKRLVEEIRDRAGEIPFSEVQLDCDWSESSQAAFFSLCDSVKAHLRSPGIQLSATIRLHQVKYLDLTGVPPVDRGMLMFYNMGDLRDSATENSILDLETAQRYLVNFDRYPLPLDLALPVFGWGVLIREGQPIRLLNQLETSELADSSRFSFPHPNRLKVLKSTYLDGVYLYQGDEIRLERSSISQISEAVALLEPIWPTQRFHLSLYHLDSHNLSYYSHEQLAEIFDVFR
ncbi:MAG: hypothetical protein AAF399_06875 [Bacteroidota bacterium]